jgi:hypothetical protein
MIGRVFVAKTSFTCLFDGEQVMISRGDTVREGHPLLADFEMFFAPQRVKFEHKPPATKKAVPRKG